MDGWGARPLRWLSVLVGLWALLKPCCFELVERPLWVKLLSSLLSSSLLVTSLSSSWTRPRLSGTPTLISRSETDLKICSESLLSSDNSSWLQQPSLHVTKQIRHQFLVKHLHYQNDYFFGEERWRWRKIKVSQDADVLVTALDQLANWRASQEWSPTSRHQARIQDFGHLLWIHPLCRVHV